MKIGDLKKLIKQSVNERVVELKEQFEHMEPKKTGCVEGQKPKTLDGVDSGDKKMTTDGAALAPIKNAVGKVSDEKGAMNEQIEHVEGQPLQHKVTNGVCSCCGHEQKGRMNEKVTDMNGHAIVEDTRLGAPVNPRARALGTPAPRVARPVRAGTPCPTCGQTRGQMQEDVEIEIPMPDGVEGAEASVEIVPGEQGEGSVAELIIVDDEVTPETIDRDTIEIQIPEVGAEELEGEKPEGVEKAEGEGFPGIEGEKPEGKQEDDFARMADLAGVQKQKK